MWPFRFENYQDVKSNLTAATVVILYIACMACYFWIMPSVHVAQLRNIRWGVWIKQLGLITVLTVVAAFLIYGIQIHDQIYDRYIVKWRDRYTSEVILPNLCRPFQDKLDSRFYTVADENRSYFMEKLFYEYAHDRDPKIRQNTIVRFYERITNYWAIQILELITYVLLLGSVLYVPVYRRLNLPVRRPLLAIVICSLIFGLTSYLAVVSRRSVQEITEEEIDEIHQNFLQDLDRRIQEVSHKFQLTYGHNN